MTARYGTVQKEKLCMNHEFLTLKQKYEDLNDSYNRVLEQRNMARSEADKLRIERDTLKADQNSVETLLKGTAIIEIDLILCHHGITYSIDKYKQLEGKELELTRFLAGHELLLKEKERMENKLNGWSFVEFHERFGIYSSKSFQTSSQMLAFQNVAKEKERMELEVTSLKRKIDDLSGSLRQANNRQDACESNSMVLNCNLQALLTENQKLIHDFKG